MREQLSKNEQINLPGDQKIERLQQDGSTVQIDELRVGGQTQAISVQPKLPLPAYQVQPEDGTRGNGTFESDASKRPSVWNIFNF